MEEAGVPDERFTRAEGSYYEVELRPGSKAEKLERKRDEISVGATKVDSETDGVSTVVYVPDTALPVLERIFRDYAEGALSEKGKPPREGYVEPIEAIRRARLRSFWTDDPAALPGGPQETIWWEVWCRPDRIPAMLAIFERMEARIADRDRWLHFPEAVVVPVLARRAEIEVATVVADGLLELRRGSDTPWFFLEEEHERQPEWTTDLAERTVWPGLDVPRVCLLDTGVNRAHILIEPALSEEDLQSADPRWVATDNARESHGTPMAGLALHGDLFPRLQDGAPHVLRHRLESVRVMPADGFPPNEPARLGNITLDAVALAEIRNPDHQRVFCLATTNRERSGGRPSTWSACVDRAAVGLDAEGEADRRRRLFCVSGGNIPSLMGLSALGPADSYPIEDPAQAWNALTVGGCTDKVLIPPEDEYFKGYTPLVEAGALSPFSRNSLAWRPGKTPIKPEIVFEAGNRARAGNTLINCPWLELLSTGADVDRQPLISFAATSAATAQASRLAAQLAGDHPELWPETIRALIVHSAEWTEAMRADLEGAGGVRDCQKLVRMFGYGIPSYERATRSARSHLALIAQQEMQPYRREGGSVRLNECHYYPLPWPKDVLRQYGDRDFRLKITLSYFVEPNPGKSAAIDPQRYQSFGLRFDLRRPRETASRFRGRMVVSPVMV